MYDTLTNLDESLLIKSLIYKAFHLTLRHVVPSKLDVLYLHRNDSRRGIANADQLIEAMQAMQTKTNVELTILQNTRLSFREQVLAFVCRDIFISIHGAAFTNILFMEPLSAVIELNPPKFRGDFYYNMAKQSTLFFYGIYNTFTANMKYSLSLVHTDQKLNQFFFCRCHIKPLPVNGLSAKNTITQGPSNCQPLLSNVGLQLS